jgi:SAM-dependent methyltransferase
LKRCLACAGSFDGAAWRCPHCGHEPTTINGIIAFAPTLSDGQENFAPEAHALLDRLQDQYFWFRARNRLIGDLVRRHAPRAGTAMEIGCGTGYVLAGLQRTLPDARLVGSEVDAGALPLARRRVGETIALFQMDARAIPFSDEFDLVCAFDVLEHIEEDEAALSEIHRALKAGGVALLGVPQHPWLWSWADDYGKHKRRYRRRELADKCRRAGFDVIFQTSFVTSLLPLMAASRLLARISPERRTDELALPPWLDRLCDAALEAERVGIKAGLRLPAGGSRFVVARKA